MCPPTGSGVIALTPPAARGEVLHPADCDDGGAAHPDGIRALDWGIGQNVRARDEDVQLAARVRDHGVIRVPGAIVPARYQEDQGGERCTARRMEETNVH